MNEYTVGLALEDFLPVIFSSIGLYFISRMAFGMDAGLGRMAAIGWILVTVGGAFKAVWKLTMALTNGQIDLAWFDKGLFIWLSAGFTLLAFALWAFNRTEVNKKRPFSPWLGAVVVMGLATFAIFSTGFPDLSIHTWRFVLLGVLTIGNVALIIFLIQRARRFGRKTAAILFLINIVIVFVLSGMARIPEQTIPLQWTEQLLNTFAQGGFAFAAWQLYRLKDQPAAQAEVRVSTAG